MRLVGQRRPEVPDSLAELRNLPGVGDYTAAAVASFAFDAVEPLIDGNIARVLARLGNWKEPIDGAAGRAFLLQSARDLLPRSGGRLHNSALMELGALVCVVRNPKCPSCPLRRECAAEGPNELPMKKPRRPIERVDDSRAFIFERGKLWLERARGPRWRGMWVLPQTQLTSRCADHVERYFITRFHVTMRTYVESRQDRTLEGYALESLPPMPSPHRRTVAAMLQRVHSRDVMNRADPVPDALGHFGPYGGRFVPETLVSALEELELEYQKARIDPEFRKEFSSLLANYCGRPTPLYFAERLTGRLGGAKIYLKREDLLHTGAHKINNAIGQALLCKRMGKKRVIAETGAGQHGVATATVAARFGFECVIYMGVVDMKRQSLNVSRMQFLGATVVPVTAGQATLKEAINEAMRDWVTNVRSTHYVLGTAYGSHPYPMMVRDFHRIIGDEARRQVLQREERLPDLLVACVGGGSNAIGLFYPFLEDESVRMVGVEAGGEGIVRGRHAARFQGGKLGVLQGAKTWLLANEDGQIELTHSVSAGLDYAAVGPEHCYLHDIRRVDYDYATDSEALAAFRLLAEVEGIVPALESAHAVAHAIKVAPKMRADQIIIINLSGRGDKDVAQAAEFLLKEDVLD